MKDRVEHILRAALAMLRALRRQYLVFHRGKALAPELVAVERGQVHIVLRIVVRIRAILDRSDDAPAAAELHRAHADEIHARLIDRAVPLLDDDAAAAAPAEIASESQADRPGADDQNRYILTRFGHATPLLSPSIHPRAEDRPRRRIS